MQLRIWHKVLRFRSLLSCSTPDTLPRTSGSVVPRLNQFETLENRFHANMDQIDHFFAQYPEFDYDRQASSPKEFYRMCDHFGWIRDHNNQYPTERNEAREAFREAMVESFNDRFGTDVNDKKAWEGICHLLKVDPLPNSVKDMKEVRPFPTLCFTADTFKLVKATHVNLSDLLDGGRSGAEVRVFDSEARLAAYTIEEERFFPKEEAYAGGVLRFLLREIIGTYLGHRQRRGRGKYRARGTRR